MVVKERSLYEYDLVAAEVKYYTVCHANNGLHVLLAIYNAQKSEDNIDNLGCT